MWGALPDRIIMDWDSTVRPKYGHQEGPQVGYNPDKPGRRSFIRSWGWWRERGYVRRIGFDPATPSPPRSGRNRWRMRSAGWWDRQVWLNRGDLGLSHDAVMSWHEEKAGRPK